MSDGKPVTRATLLAACMILAGSAAQARSVSASSLAGASLSQSTPLPGNGSPASNNDPSPAEPGFLSGLFSPSRTNLLGDIYDIRSLLDEYGISLGLQETSEVLGNVTGGVRRGAAYEGLTLMSLGVDLGRAIGLQGGIFNVSAFQIHGRNLSADNLYTLQTASSIEALRATRLWELWYQQSFAGGKADIKIGQQSLDQEFYGSVYSGLFVNTMMGWPLVPSVNLYAGGPAYPLSSLGVRLRVQPIDDMTVLAGVYDDNPPGGSFFDDSQLRGASRSGTKFNLRTGALIFGEVQYAIDAPVLGQMNHGNGKPGLPGTYKLGFYYDTAKFYDQRLDTTGLSLADPDTSGDPLVRRGNFSVYGVFDQAVWRPDPDAAKTVGVFARIMGAPGDRNLAIFSINGGVVMKAPFAGRETDSAGLGFGFTKISPSATSDDRDRFAINGISPVRGSETFLEATYQYQVAPWWTLQPDFQYVFTPAGGISNPLQPGKHVGNSATFGLRANIVF